MTSVKIFFSLIFSLGMVIGLGFITPKALACNCFQEYGAVAYYDEYPLYNDYSYAYGGQYRAYHNPYTSNNYYSYNTPGAFVGDMLYSLANNYLNHSYYAGNSYTYDDYGYDDYSNSYYDGGY